MNVSISITLKPQVIEGAFKEPAQTRITLEGDTSITLKFASKLLLDLIDTTSKIDVAITKLEG